MHGFTQVAVREHEFARWLRKHKALDNWQAHGTSNVWYGTNGESVAVCIYDNAACTCTYWVRDALRGSLPKV